MQFLSVIKKDKDSNSQGNLTSILNSGIKNYQRKGSINQNSDHGLSPAYLEKIRLANEGRYHGAQDPNKKRIINAKLSRSKKGGFKAHLVQSPENYTSPKETRIDNTPDEHPVINENYKAHLKIGKSASKIHSKKKNNFGPKDSTINSNINVQHSNTVVKKPKQSFAYDESLTGGYSALSKNIIEPIPFNMDMTSNSIGAGVGSGLVPQKQDSAYSYSNQKNKSHEKEFTIRKNKSRKEVECNITFNYNIQSLGFLKNGHNNADWSIVDCPDNQQNGGPNKNQSTIY